MMNDQAEKLRKIIENLKIKQAANQTNIVNTAQVRHSRVITITSGKGGVGKTNITINLAIILSQLGLRVVILDADFGLANIDVLFGIIPQYTLVDVINGRKNIIEILSNGPQNIKFISGGSGVEKLLKLEQSQLDRFVQNMALLDKIADVILVDTGAGLNENVMSFVMAADEVMLITTPEPTSITDAYALIKILSHRDKQKAIKVVINKADTSGEADEILKKLSLVCDKFLSVKLQPLGFVLNDDMVKKAVKEQQPFTIGYPKCSASRNIEEIAKKLLDVETHDESQNTQGIKKFVNRLVSFFKQP